MVVSSCMGDPAVDELVEDDEQIGIRIVTTMVVSGDVAACQDEVQITLQQPLGARDVVDLVSGEALTVTPLSAVGSNSDSCVEVDIQFDEEPVGDDTADKAIEEFAATNDFLAAATFDGGQILYQGEVVGQVVVSSTSEGGYVVTNAEYCCPDDF